MAQHDYVIANGTGAAVRSDLNNALAAIVSNNSGSTAPATTYAYQWWADTTAGQLKLRNAANDNWIVIQELDGTMLMEAGSAASPGLAFASDLDTGLFSAGTNALGIATNGVERVEFGTSEVVFNDGGADVDFRIEGDTNANLFFVDAGNDRVGIGTSTARAGLTVALGSSSIPAAGASTASAVFSNATDGAVYGVNIGANTSGLGYIQSQRTDGTATTYDLAIQPNGGRVGIGTTSPSSPLHVVGNSSGDFLKGGIRINDTNNSSDYFLGGLASGSFQIATAPAGLTRFIIDSSGRVLVGTFTAPIGGSYNLAAKLVAQGNTSSSTGAAILALNRGESATTITSAEEIGAITFGDNAGNEFAYITCRADADAGASDFPGRLTFHTTADSASSPTERMRINNVGGLKVYSDGAAAVTSATNSAHELTTDRNGGEALFVANRSSSSPVGMQVYYSTDINNTANYFFTCYGTGNLRAGFRSNGGLANYSANDANLSDRNAKKDISPAAGTWDCIKEWEIVNYRYKDQPDDADLNLGVIAQQVAESCPEVITIFSEAKDAKPAVLDDDGNEIEPAQEAQPKKLGVKEQQMYWMAIKALQEAQVRIEQLEAKVAALESA